MKRPYLLFILLLTLITKTTLSQSPLDSIQFNITISSNNLSEDMNSLSSGNDELILLVYGNDTPLYNTPLLQQEFVFNKNYKNISFPILLHNGDNMDLSILIIERDSRQSITRIEAVTRLYSKKIKQLFDRKEITALEEYLGNEDLLLFCHVDLQGIESTSCSHEYINNLDKYQYQVTVTTR